MCFRNHYNRANATQTIRTRNLRPCFAKVLFNQANISTALFMKFIAFLLGGRTLQVQRKEASAIILQAGI